jgi:hypothetical protein
LQNHHNSKKKKQQKTPQTKTRRKKQIKTTFTREFIEKLCRRNDEMIDHRNSMFYDNSSVYGVNFMYISSCYRAILEEHARNQDELALLFVVVIGVCCI